MKFLPLRQRVRTEGFWEEWLGFFLEGTKTTACQAASAAVQILHLFEADQKNPSLGRKTVSAPRFHEYIQAHPLIKIGPTAQSLKLSVPTLTGALESLAKLKIKKEVTGKRRNRLFSYPRYLHILSEGTEPSKITEVNDYLYLMTAAQAQRMLWLLPLDGLRRYSWAAFQAQFASNPEITAAAAGQRIIRAVVRDDSVLFALEAV